MQLQMIRSYSCAHQICRKGRMPCCCRCCCRARPSRACADDFPLVFKVRLSYVLAVKLARCDAAVDETSSASGAPSPAQLAGSRGSSTADTYLSDMLSLQKCSGKADLNLKKEIACLPDSPPTMAEVEMEAETPQATPFTLAMIAGGCAGTTVDVVLYPLDTLKTRLQSSEGFIKAGGFKGVYNGVLATALGAAPGAAMFFSAYEGMKPVLLKANGGREHWLQHSLAASAGEVAACLVRVPTAVVTQNMQVGQYGSFMEAVRGIASSEAGSASFYRGFWTTVAREIPFSFIQFPLCVAASMYERLKKIWWSIQGHETSPMQGAACGSFAGAVAAAATTPLDVVKTRLMLGAKNSKGEMYSGTLATLNTIIKEEGAGALFKGIGPRVGWITIGGCAKKVPKCLCDSQAPRFTLGTFSSARTRSPSRCCGRVALGDRRSLMPEAFVTVTRAGWPLWARYIEREYATRCLDSLYCYCTVCLYKPLTVGRRAGELEP
eukprot:6181192-Pleurochrysis_carterae.AAC.4